MAENRVFLVSSLALCFFVASCYAVEFSSLSRTLVVTASFPSGRDLKSGEDNITVTWSHNNTFPRGTDSSYKTIKIKLCYAPVSQVDRAWRKTEDHLKKDKTCQFNIVTRPYTSGSSSFTWTIERDIPTATYFVRAYAYDSAGHEVAFGQFTDAKKTTNLFTIQAITGRHISLDIASICFSCFSVVSLFGFFFLEKRKAKSSQQK